MEWWRFFAWNAAGGIVWAAGVSILAYYAGAAVAEAVNRYGLYGAVAAIVLVAAVVVAAKIWRNRMVEG